MENLQETVVQRVFSVATEHPDFTALYFRKTLKSSIEALTYRQLWEEVSAFAASLIQLGIHRGDHVAIISDNRKEWLVCDLAVMGLRAIDIPRGSDSNAQEINYIISHSDSDTVILENRAQLHKLLSENPHLSSIKTLILLEGEADEAAVGSARIFSFSDLLNRGRTLSDEQAQFNQTVRQGQREDLASIIYTSGTTGNPKGVMLTQESFVFQLENIYDLIPIQPKDILLSVLPIWHTFERACEYIILNRGGSIAYSKPIGPIMLGDLKALNPQWFISVPRIWESIYDAILRKLKAGSRLKYHLVQFFLKLAQAWYRCENLWNQKNPALAPINPTVNRLAAFPGFFLLWPLKTLGDRLAFAPMRRLLGEGFIAGVSGGGALPPHVDSFFQAIGVTVLEGYGMTETGPIISVRRTSHPILYTIGEPLHGIQFEIRNPQGKPLPPASKGKLFIQSPQIMQGYYKNEAATEQVLCDGWLDTGDLAIETYNRHALKIVGRAKETIVLSGGENIEPAPLEERLIYSEAIDNAMVVGQDQKYLAAIVCVNIENAKAALGASLPAYIDDSEFLQSEPVKSFIFQEIQQLISVKNGFKPFEKIYKIIIADKPFTVDDELTKTLKLRRSFIEKKYQAQIAQLFKG